MPDLLLELFSEEIPARMQRRAAEDLQDARHRRARRARLRLRGRQGLSRRRGGWRSTSRGCPCKGRDVREERKGPRVGAPEAAVQGFLKSAGLASLDQAKIQSDPEEGRVLRGARSSGPGGRRRRCWPRSCRPSSEASRGRSRCAGARPPREPGALRWVRPLQSIVCTFGPETEEPEVVRFSVDGIASGRRHPRPPLHGARADPRAPLRRLRAGAGARQGRARRGPPQGHHPARCQATSPSPRVSNSSRTRGSSKRSPASSSGRSFSWAPSTRAFSTSRRR